MIKATAEQKRRWRRGWGFLRRRFGAIAGLSIICLFYAVAVFADFLAPYHYDNPITGRPTPVPPLRPWVASQAGPPNATR